MRALVDIVTWTATVLLDTIRNTFVCFNLIYCSKSAQTKNLNILVTLKTSLGMAVLPISRPLRNSGGEYILIFHLPWKCAQFYIHYICLFQHPSAARTVASIDSLRAGRSGDRIPWGGRGGGRDIFRARPYRPWGPPSLVHIGYRIFQGGKAAEAWRWPPNPHLAPKLKEE
jgi:hypothetical protein